MFYRVLLYTARHCIMLYCVICIIYIMCQLITLCFRTFRFCFISFCMMWCYYTLDPIVWYFATCYLGLQAGSEDVMRPPEWSSGDSCVNAQGDRTSGASFFGIRVSGLWSSQRPRLEPCSFGTRSDSHGQSAWKASTLNTQVACKQRSLHLQYSSAEEGRKSS